MHVACVRLSVSLYARNTEVEDLSQIPSRNIFFYLGGAMDKLESRASRFRDHLLHGYPSVGGVILNILFILSTFGKRHNANTFLSN